MCFRDVLRKGVQSQCGRTAGTEGVQQKPCDLLQVPDGKQLSPPTQRCSRSSSNNGMQNGRRRASGRLEEPVPCDKRIAREEMRI